eukprot:TRINITY_DN2218_c0_g1_i1.p1 TRINITY_DN2218_c0_g1~~TRINITY_DN2218_c0_g1_i1.p1  ORF type:complete len:311 (-),score=58.58 TRINITY_DN2218_c0_g1_i1:186-1118(-)
MLHARGWSRMAPICFIVLIALSLVFTYERTLGKRHRRQEKLLRKARRAEEQMMKWRAVQMEHLRRVEERDREMAESWNETLAIARETQPKLCMVIRTFEKHEKTLAPLLFNLINTEFYQNFYIVLTDTVYSYRQKYLTDVVKLIDDPRVVITPLLQPYSKERERLAKKKNNTSGYEDTNAETDRLLKMGGCDYFLYTNGDNQYALGFLDRLHLLMIQGPPWITYNFTCYAIKHRPMPSYGSTDLGASVISKEIYELMPDLRFEDFRVYDTMTIPWHDSDYKLHEKIMQRYQLYSQEDRLMLLKEILLSHL